MERFDRVARSVTRGEFHRKRFRNLITEQKASNYVFGQTDWDTKTNQNYVCYSLALQTWQTKQIENPPAVVRVFETNTPIFEKIMNKSWVWDCQARQEAACTN